MDNYDQIPVRQDDAADGARSALSGEFSAMGGGDEPPKLKPTGEGSSVLQPPGTPFIPAPRIETPPAPRVEAPPAPRVEAPPAVARPVDAQAGRVSEVVAALTDANATQQQVARKIETAFKAEPDRAAMSRLADRINTEMKGTGVYLDFHAYRNHRTNNAVTVISPTGRPYELALGPGTGLAPKVDAPAPTRTDVPPVRTDAPAPTLRPTSPTSPFSPKLDVPPVTRTEVPPTSTSRPASPFAPRVEAPPATRTDAPPPVAQIDDGSDRKVTDVANTLNSKTPQDQVIKKLELAFRTEPDRAAMADLANQINGKLKGTGISIDVHPYRNHRTNMAITVSGTGRTYEVFIGPGTGRR